MTEDSARSSQRIARPTPVALAFYFVGVSAFVAGGLGAFDHGFDERVLYFAGFGLLWIAGGEFFRRFEDAF